MKERGGRRVDCRLRPSLELEVMGSSHAFCTAQDDAKQCGTVRPIVALRLKNPGRW